MRRASEERELAKVAAYPRSAAVHAELAERYENLLLTLELARMVNGRERAAEARRPSPTQARMRRVSPLSRAVHRGGVAHDRDPLLALRGCIDLQSWWRVSASH